VNQKPAHAHVAVRRPSKAVLNLEERLQQAASILPGSQQQPRQRRRKVRALKAEMSTDTAMVTANC